ncbi:Fum17p [Fusarium nygamai]|uniref:Fum17p n=1 Tax=Gibberella nygamai TaxID=42673 RepID=A0A2K0WCW5_GIBNY|nr:Fum17p [Fusarium nygamai]
MFKTTTSVRRRPGQRNSLSTLTTRYNDQGIQGYSLKDKEHKIRRRKRCWEFRHSVLNNSWALPLSLAIVLPVIYAFHPVESNFFGHFILLSYRHGSVTDGVAFPVAQYQKGLWDLAFVAFYANALFLARKFIMERLLRPLARKNNILTKGKQQRFMEQMYTACYFAVMGPFGLYVTKTTPGLWLFQTHGMYDSYPHRSLGPAIKFYYLFQAAYWVQQSVVLVLRLEKPRKDHMELTVHHIITIALIALSYRFHFTHIGISVYITHDISDLFLAASKSLNYLGHRLQTPAFCLCVIAWIYLRHYTNWRILYSVLTEFRTVGPFELDWEAQQYKCRLSQFITFGLLAALQTLNIIWLYCLFRNAYRLLFLGIAKDDRSDTDESEIEHGD